jgi:signal transduction histidine kinase
MWQTRIRGQRPREHNDQMADAARSRVSAHEPIRPVGLVSAVTTTAVVMMTLLGIARQDPTVSLERRLPLWLIVLGIAGAVSVTAAAWVTRVSHPHASAGLAAIAGGVSLPLWAGWSISSAARAAVLAAPPLAVAGIAHLALRWRAGSTTSPALVAVYVLTVMAVAVHLVGYNPFADPTCRRACVDVRPLAERILDTKSVVALTCALTIGATVLAALAVVLSRPSSAPPVIIGAALGALLLSAVAAAVRWATWRDRPLSDTELVCPPFAIATLIGGAALVDAAYGTHRTRAAVDHLVKRLAAPASGWGDVRGVVRGVHFAVPDDGWVDSDGHPVAEHAGLGRVIVISDESGPMLRLLLTHNTDAADVLARLTPATRLALRNAQLTAVAKARLADVRSSRRRIVAASDAERQRIERDLHDGAQQRLVSAAFHLSLARSHSPEHVGPIDDAETHVREALAQLRKLAHGIFPSALATEGLHAALDDLVRAVDVSVTLDLQGSADVPAETAMAAYAIVDAVLGRPQHAATAAVSVVNADGVLTVRVESDDAAAPPELTEVADRVGAVGGDMTVTSTPGTTVVTATLPCAS